MVPSRDTTTQARPSVHFQTHDDIDMAHALQRQVSQGSPSACLSLGDVTFAAAIQRNRSSSSSRSSFPRSRSRSDADNAPYFARAASLYITGLVWAFSLSSPALARRHSPGPTASSSASPGKTSTAVESPIRPPARDYALICNLTRNLTFVLQKAPFHRRRHHLNDAALVLPEMQAGVHQAVLHDTLGVLGWTATTSTDDDPSGIVTIPTIAYRLSKQFLPALLHAEGELTVTASAGSNGAVRGEDNSNCGALMSLLGDLSSAAAMAHNARGHSSSSSIAETDSAADESNSNSSYPTSPETRLLRLDISHDQDNDESNEEILNDSPPTTPSHTSSSDDLSKPLYTTTTTSCPTHPHHQHVAFRNILQERLGGIDTKSHTNTVGFPRSNTIDTISSGVSSPISHRSRSSSIRSTASSIFERMCGQPKSKTTLSLHAEPQSTMGSFTPVSAKTASTSLRRFNVPTTTSNTTTGRMWGARMKSRLGMPTEFWDSDDDGVKSDSAAPSPAKPIIRRHARSATTVDVPAISMTHASFIPESMLNVLPRQPPHSRANAPTRSQTQPQPQARATPPRSRTPSKASAPIPSIASVLAPRAQVPQRSQTDPISGPTRGLPKLDPTLAALEKGCRLKAKVSCAHCGKVGWDFPKNRQGDALCTRECRVAFKALSEGKGKGREGAVVVRVGA